MKYIEVPDTIALVNPETGESVEGQTFMSFRSYAYRVWLADKRGIDGNADTTAPEATERWAKVISAFAKAQAGGVVALEDADYKVLKKIVETPSLIIGNALIEVQLMPFVQAVLKATNEAPKTIPIPATETNLARS